MKKWKILKSKKIFSHPRLTLVEDDILLPNGIKSKYLKFKDDGNAVTIICKRDDGRILLQKEYSHPPQEWLYQFPGGLVPLKEDIKKGANRELMEEAKYEAKKLKLLGGYLVNNRRSKSKMFVFLATNFIKKSKAGDVEETIESYWFSEKQVEKMIVEGKIMNCHVLASWTLYKLRK
jgi:8-oxo-dGTP pyrophosphatase MutT (NUDIX family)